jgi:hypothetical protein
LAVGDPLHVFLQLGLNFAKPRRLFCLLERLVNSAGTSSGCHRSASSRNGLRYAAVDEACGLAKKAKTRLLGGRS